MRAEAVTQADPAGECVEEELGGGAALKPSMCSQRVSSQPPVTLSQAPGGGGQQPHSTCALPALMAEPH